MLSQKSQDSTESSAGGWGAGLLKPQEKEHQEQTQLTPRDPAGRALGIEPPVPLLPPLSSSGNIPHLTCPKLAK